MQSAADDYSWINDSALSEAACVTVIPDADRAAVLAAFGGGDDSELDPQSPLDVARSLNGRVIQVVQVGAAVLVIEDNGFEGTRPEVLGPLSQASGIGTAAAFFWNVNAVTSFTAAHRGEVRFAVELLGIEDVDDEELRDVPSPLRALVVEGGSEEGDMLGAGLALVATHTSTPFAAEVLDAGRWYEIEPTPSQLETHTVDGYDPLSQYPGALRAIHGLTPVQQRALAHWATSAAVRESGMAGEPVVHEVLRSFGAGSAQDVPPGLDRLARTTAAEHERFMDLEQNIEIGGLSTWPRHSYYEAVAEAAFGEERALSHLEGAYLGQRRWAVDTLRNLANPDAYSAAVSCLFRADTVFSLGRTTRSWTFDEDATGRHRRGLPNREPVTSSSCAQ